MSNCNFYWQLKLAARKLRSLASVETQPTRVSWSRVTFSEWRLTWQLRQVQLGAIQRVSPVKIQCASHRACELFIQETETCLFIPAVAAKWHLNFPNDLLGKRPLEVSLVPPRWCRLSFWMVSSADVTKTYKRLICRSPSNGSWHLLCYPVQGLCGSSSRNFRWYSHSNISPEFLCMLRSTWKSLPCWQN